MSAAIEASQRDLGATAPLVPGTKTARHASIVQILSRERIRSQAELRKALAQRGISTTQATLSRDLVELRATKIRAPGGELIYSMPEAGAPGQVHTGALSEPEETEDSLRAHTTPPSVPVVRRATRYCRVGRPPGGPANSRRRCPAARRGRRRRHDARRHGVHRRRRHRPGHHPRRPGRGRRGQTPARPGRPLGPSLTSPHHPLTSPRHLGAAAAASSRREE